MQLVALVDLIVDYGLGGHWEGLMARWLDQLQSRSTEGGLLADDQGGSVRGDNLELWGKIVQHLRNRKCLATPGAMRVGVFGNRTGSERGIPRDNGGMWK